MRSPSLLLIRMNAAETSASRAIADWTPLTVVSRSPTTAEMETFISDVSTTSTNMAAASRTANRVLGGRPSGMRVSSMFTRPLRAASGRRCPGCSAHALPARHVAASPTAGGPSSVPYGSAQPAVQGFAPRGLPRRAEVLLTLPEDAVDGGQEAFVAVGEVDRDLTPGRHVHPSAYRPVRPDLGDRAHGGAQPLC